MRDMFEAIGYLDAVQSITAWRSTLPGWTTPEFTEARKALHVEALIHPLLTDPVPNSLNVEDASVLITGSNMSGKTTFVRAMGVSAVLTQTLHTACAGVWRAPILRVRTSIGRADSIMDGKSYYLAEVESVRTLVLVATHDIEVLDLLGGSYGAHHFREEIADGAMTFDYRIRVGPSSTRNAIALLELMQYPAELVADALRAINRPGYP